MKTFILYLLAALMPLVAIEYYDWRWVGHDETGSRGFILGMTIVGVMAILVEKAIRSEKPKNQ